MARACSRCGTRSTVTMEGALCPACLLRLASLPEAQTPDFEIETLLGRGLGTTYLARDASSGALLAVKDLGGAAGPGAADALDDLRAEMTAFAHPSCVPLLALDVDLEGRVRLVRAFVAGRPFSAQAAGSAAVLTAITGAVAALHDAGLAHGHLTPDNVVIGPGGRVLLLDAGAAEVHAAVRGEPYDRDAARRDDLVRLAGL